MKSGIIILSEIQGAARERILEIQRRFDPKLAAGVPPHLTLSGSSGMGPITTSTPIKALRVALEPVARETAPLTLSFQKPIRFMQTNVVVLPLDPNGPVRALHERIKSSGLTYEQPKFTFTPHVTLSFFRELSPADVEALLAVRVPDRLRIDTIAVYRTVDILDSKKLFELPLTGTR